MSDIISVVANDSVVQKHVLKVTNEIDKLPINKKAELAVPLKAQVVFQRAAMKVMADELCDKAVELKIWEEKFGDPLTQEEKQRYLNTGSIMKRMDEINNEVSHKLKLRASRTKFDESDF
jgi:hypothetical protein